MSKDSVKVSLKSRIVQEGQVSTVKENYVGTYKALNGSHLVRMKDKDKGMMTVKVASEGQEVTCLWEKHAMKRIHFVKDKKTILHYQLPHQQLVLEVETKDIQVVVGPKGLTKISLAYDLHYEGSPFGAYQLDYQFIHLD